VFLAGGYLAHAKYGLPGVRTEGLKLERKQWPRLEDRGGAGICCAADLAALCRVQMALLAGFGMSRREVRGISWVAAGLFAALSGCTALPSWTGLRVPEGTPAGPVAYPDLARMPGAPPVLTTPEQKAEIAESLAADRALTAQAGQNLRRDVEESFEIPQRPAGP
jgi:hypothetical protein